MIYLGYADKEVVERLPFLLSEAKVSLDRKIKVDFANFDSVSINTILDHSEFRQFDQQNPNLFFIFPINQYYGRKASQIAFKLIKQNRTVIFCNIDSNEELQYLVINNGKVHSKSYTEQRYFKLEMLTIKYVDPYFETVAEILDDRKTAYLIYTKLKDPKQSKFRRDIEMLFDTIDATVDGKNQLVQKLIYVLQFAKYSDSYMLRETYGEDAIYLAETVMANWKKLFKVHMDPNDIAVVYEPEILDLEIIDRLNFEDNLNYEGDEINE